MKYLYVVSRMCLAFWNKKSDTMSEFRSLRLAYIVTGKISLVYRLSLAIGRFRLVFVV